MSLFKMKVGERAQPLAKAGAVMMALPLVMAGTMWVRPPAILVLLLPTLLAAVLRRSLLLVNGSQVLELLLKVLYLAVLFCECSLHVTV